MNLKFSVQQIALLPPDPARAIALLTAMGITDWVHDTVTAHGTVFGEPEPKSVGKLAFNYTGLAEARELEVLGYQSGKNWMDRHGPSVSHIGTHCTDSELSEWFGFFKERGIPIAQELFTEDHTNAAIRNQRWYHYVIFDTRAILGCDVKFIVRSNQPAGTEPEQRGMTQMECTKCNSHSTTDAGLFSGRALCPKCGD